MLDLVVVTVLASLASPQVLLRDLNPVSVATPVLLSRVGEVPGRVLFQRDDSLEAGLWVTDGTAAGTGLLLERFGAVPVGPVSTGSHCFFFAGNGCDGRRWLWRSDGTRVGTVAVAAAEATCDMVAFRGGVCFGARDAGGEELWCSDGTAAGTRRVVDLRPGPDSSSPCSLVVAGDRVLFLATDGAGVRGLWQTDGTAAGTRAVATAPILALARLGDALAYATTVGSSASLRLYDPTSGVERELWRGPMLVETFRAFAASDAAVYFTMPSLPGIAVTRVGTEGDVTVVHQGPFDFRSGFRVAGDAVIFEAADFNGARVFGTRGGPAAPLFPASGDGLRRAGSTGKRVFVGTNEAPDGATYVTDGSPAGTRQLARPGAATWLGELGDDAVLGLASAAINSLERVRADSSRLDRITHWKPTSSGGSLPLGVAAGVGAAMFVTQTSEGPALFWTDGTPGGTQRIAGGEPSEFVMAAERGWFSVGPRLYTTLGSPASTRLVRDFTPYGIRGLVGRGDDLIAFFARPGADELLWVTRNGVVYQIPFTEAWVTAGTRPIVTEAGVHALVTLSSGGVSLQRWAPRTFRTEAVVSLAADSSYVGRMGNRLVMLEGGAVVTYDEATRAVVRTGVLPPTFAHGVFPVGERMLWTTGSGVFATDGTLAGSGWITPQVLGHGTVVGDLLYAAGFDSTAGTEPWVSDGTAAGTQRLADIEPGRCPSYPFGFAAAGSGRQVLFSATTAAHGTELWTSDGTTAGTRLVADLAPVGSGRPSRIMALGPRIVFWAEHPVAGDEPWTMPAGLVGGYVVRPLGGDCVGGVIPMQVSGAPRLGDARFGFRVRGSTPGAASFVLGASIAATPFGSCALRAGDVLASLPARSNASNEFLLAAPVPTDPGLLGTPFVVQCLLHQGAVAVSEAVYVIVGR